MRLFGQLSELLKVVWRKNGKEVILEPAEPTAASNTVTIPDPDGGADTVVLNDTPATLTQKTISGASNTISDVDGDAVVVTPAGNLTSTNAQAALEELQADVDTRALDADLTAHETQATGAHAATAISFDSALNSLTAINVQTALAEAAGRLDTAESNISSNDTDISNLQSGKLNRDGTQAMTGALDMGTFAITNVGNVDGVDVSQLKTDFDAHLADPADAHDASAISVVATGNLASTDVQAALQELQTDVDTRALDADLSSHVSATTGIHGITSGLVGVSESQTLTNKTLTDVLINGMRLTTDTKAIASNSFGLNANTTVYRLTSGTGPLNTIIGADVSESDFIVLVNETGASLTLTNDFGADGFLTGTGADLVIEDDAAVTLVYSLSASRWNIVGGAGGGGGLSTEFVSADVSPAANNTHYLVDSSGAPRTITLPDSPQPGAVVRVSDEGGTASTNNITIQAGAGDTIEGDSSFIIDVDNGWAQLSWDGTSDWHVDTLAVNDGAGILSLNGLTATAAPTQTFATGAAGTDFSISSSGSTHTFNIPDAGASARGLVTTGTQTIAGAKTFSDDLTVGSTTLFADVSTGSVGIGTPSPDKRLHVSSAFSGSAGLSANVELLVSDTDNPCGVAIVSSDSDSCFLDMRDTTGNRLRITADDTDELFIDVGASFARAISATSSGAVTLGPSSGGPTAGHSVQAAANNTSITNIGVNNADLLIKNTRTSAAGERTAIRFDQGGVIKAMLAVKNEGGATGSSFEFYTRDSGNVTRLGLVVGQTGAVTLGPSGGAAVSHTLWSSNATTTDNTAPLLVKTTGAASSQRYMQFYYAGTTAAGGIRRATTTQNVEFFSGSDRRLKENIVDAPPLLDKLLQVKIRHYNIKGEAGPAIGVIAQELAEVFPEKVGQTDDGLGDELPEGQQPWDVGESWHYELIKAIQELHAELQEAKARIQTLEGGS